MHTSTRPHMHMYLDSAGTAWGNAFRVKWQTIYDLNFNDVAHLRNPYNENKPIKISRDGQEVGRG